MGTLAKDTYGEGISCSGSSTCRGKKQCQYFHSSSMPRGSGTEGPCCAPLAKNRQAMRVRQDEFSMLKRPIYIEFVNGQSNSL